MKQKDLKDDNLKIKKTLVFMVYTKVYRMHCSNQVNNTAWPLSQRPTTVQILYCIKNYILCVSNILIWSRSCSIKDNL